VTAAATATSTATATPTSTETATAAATDTPAPSPTATASPTPTETDTPAPAPTTTATPAAPVYDAAFVADVTIPDGTTLAPGEPFTKTWRLRNTGDAPWEVGAELVLADGVAMGAPERVPVVPAAPGETVDVSVPMVAPPDEGTHRAIWRLCHAEACFGGTVAVEIVSRSAATERGLAVELPPAAVEGCPYIGNSNTGKFHYARCSSVGQMKEEHKVCLQSREEAIARGFVPCKRCDP